jgi:hypothetical protein
MLRTAKAAAAARSATGRSSWRLWASTFGGISGRRWCFAGLLALLATVFWAGMLRKLPHTINQLTECEAKCRFDPQRVFRAGYASTARRLLEDPRFVEVSGPADQRASWTLCRWAQPDLMTPYINDADEADPMYQSTATLLDMLDELALERGTVTVARSGVALGVYRDQRRLSCDSDLDLWIIAKDGDLHNVYEALRRIVPKYGTNYSLADLERFSSIYYDSRMALGRIEHAPDGNKIDFELMTEGFALNSVLDSAYMERCGVSVRKLFSKLCWSRHGGRTRSVAAFSDMTTYLTSMYGPDFDKPAVGHYDQRCTIQVHTPKEILRWWPFRLLRWWLELQPAIDLDDPLDSH